MIFPIFCLYLWVILRQEHIEMWMYNSENMLPKQPFRLHRLFPFQLKHTTK